MIECEDFQNPFGAYDVREIYIDDTHSSLYRTGFRFLNTGLLNVKAIERKFPHEWMENNGGRVALYMQLYSDVTVSPEDALEMLEQNEGRIVRLHKSQLTQTEAKKQFEHFKIDPEGIIASTRVMFTESIARLHLPVDLEARALHVHNTIDVVLDYDNLTDGSFESPVYINNDVSGVVVVINASDVLLAAKKIALETRTDVTHDLIVTLLVSHTAHELAHGLNQKMSRKGYTLAHYVSSFIPSDMSDYPITWKKAQSQVSINNRLSNYNERFAVFFERDIVDLIGLPFDAISKYREIALSKVLYALHKISPKRWTQLHEAVILKYPKKHPLRIQIEEDIDAIIGGSLIAQCYPFSRDEVYFGFLNQAKTDSTLNDLNKTFQLFKKYYLK